MGTEIITEATVQGKMEEALWQFIDLAGMFPSIKPDDRIWGHILAYMPTHITIPKFVTNEQEL